MKVRLISHSDLGPLVCGYAAKVCTSAEMPECPDELAVTRREGEVSPFKKALDHALASGHESVLEHWSATFAIEGISRACSHQLVRHRLASYSQQSQRYVNMGEFEYVIPESIENWNCVNEYEYIIGEIQHIYDHLVRMGVPEEDARYILPNACCTNIVVTMNGRQLRKFFMLRCCNRAQWEIREMANLMLAEVKQVAPIIFENAGASCDVLGYCPEQRSCGKCQKLKTLLDKNTTT